MKRVISIFGIFFILAGLCLAEVYNPIGGAGIESDPVATGLANAAQADADAAQGDATDALADAAAAQGDATTALADAAAAQADADAAALLAVTNKFAVINVLDYGAIPDDGLDDTPAFEAADAACGGGTNTIYAPGGEYDVTNWLITKALRVVGDGRWSTILKTRTMSVGNHQGTIIISNNTGGVTLDRLNLQGFGRPGITDSASSWTSGVWIKGVNQYFECVNSKIGEYEGHGVFVEGSGNGIVNDAHLENLVIYNVGNSNIVGGGDGHGIAINGNRVLLSNITINNIRGRGVEIWLSGSAQPTNTFYTLRDVTVTDAMMDGVAGSGAAGSLRRVGLTLDNVNLINTTSRPTIGTPWNGFAIGQTTQLKMSNCSVICPTNQYAQFSAGIQVGSTDQGSIVGCHTFNLAAFGFDITGGSTTGGVTVADCSNFGGPGMNLTGGNINVHDFNSTIRSGLATGNGVVLNSSSHVRLSDLRIKGYPFRGIQFAATAHTDVFMHNIDVRDNGTGIQNFGTLTGYRITGYMLADSQSEIAGFGADYAGVVSNRLVSTAISTPTINTEYQNTAQISTVHADVSLDGSGAAAALRVWEGTGATSEVARVVNANSAVTSQHQISWTLQPMQKFLITNITSTVAIGRLTLNKLP